MSQPLTNHWNPETETLKNPWNPWQCGWSYDWTVTDLEPTSQHRVCPSLLFIVSYFSSFIMTTTNLLLKILQHPPSVKCYDQLYFHMVLLHNGLICAKYSTMVAMEHSCCLVHKLAVHSCLLLVNWLWLWMSNVHSLVCLHNEIFCYFSSLLFNSGHFQLTYHIYNNFTSGTGGDQARVPHSLMIVLAALKGYFFVFMVQYVSKIILVF